VERALITYRFVTFATDCAACCVLGVLVCKGVVTILEDWLAMFMFNLFSVPSSILFRRRCMLTSEAVAVDSLEEFEVSKGY